MNNNYLDCLKEWTNCSSFVTLYDTRYDEFSIQHMQRAIYSRDKVVLLIETDKKDLFGSFHSQVSPKSVMERRTQHTGWVWEYDEEMFMFSLNNHTNPNHPLKFKQNGNWDTCLCLNTSEMHFEIVYWICYCVNLIKPLNSSKSFVYGKINDYFEMNSPDVLIGESGLFNGFNPRRVLLLQGF